MIDHGLAHRRQQFMRPDAWRYLKPGAEGYDPPPGIGYQEPAHYRRARELREADEAKAAAAQAEADERAFQRELGSIRFELAMLRLALKARRARQLRLGLLVAAKAGFDPNQPRVPAGNPDGGQWTDAGGGGGDDSRIISDVGVDDALFGIGDRLAQSRSGLPVDLLEERDLGGHAIERHVGKSQQYLLYEVQRQALSSTRRGDFADGLRQGSFPSLEAANKLVNATIARNQEKVDLVVSGALPRADLDAVFSAPTGYEAYARTERSQTIIRDTYGVRVTIIPDRSAAKGYRVDTAFPRNFGR